MTENTPTPDEQQTPRWDTPVPHAVRDEVIQAAEEELDLGGDAGSVTLTVVNELHRLGLIRPADDALEAVSAERDALAATVDLVRAWADTPLDQEGGGWIDLDRILSTAPATVLAQVKADAWDEGYDTWSSSPAGEQPPRDNPYRGDPQ